MLLYCDLQRKENYGVLENTILETYRIMGAGTSKGTVLYLLVLKGGFLCCTSSERR